MPPHDYHLITRWRVRASLEQVYGILIRADHYPLWWSQAFLDARELPGGHPGGERVGCFLTKGYLPYTLSFRARVSERRFPHGFAIETGGDFEGRGVCSFARRGAWVHATYDWRVRVTKPLIRYASFLLKV